MQERLREVLGRIETSHRRILGGNLRGIYVHGSIASGCFRLFSYRKLKPVIMRVCRVSKIDSRIRQPYHVFAASFPSVYVTALNTRIDPQN